MDPKAKLLDDIVQLTDQTLSKLMEEWKIMYNLTPEIERKYCQSLFQIVENIYKDAIEAEIEKKHEMIESIKSCIVEQSNLEKELREKIPKCNDETAPLQEVLKSINLNLEAYRRKKTERVEKLQELRQKEAVLCKIVAAEPKEIPSAVPTEHELQELKFYITSLESIKIERTAKLQTCKTQFYQMLEQLEIADVEDPFEKLLIETSEEEFILSQQNMDKLEELKEKYEKLTAEAKERIQALQQKLELLWIQIATVDNGKASFQPDGRIGKTAELILTNEIARCQAVRKSMMKEVITHLRTQISHLWDLMYYTQEQRDAFRAYYVDLFNEDIFELHETEFRNLQEFYDNHRTIFNLATKREKYIEKLRELDLSAKDPKRLLNRGGQLLKDEKERKATKANLLKNDNQLVELLTDFTERTGSPFVWNGQDLYSLVVNGVSCSKPNLTEIGNGQHSRMETPQSKENRSATKRKRDEPDGTFIVHQPLLPTPGRENIAHALAVPMSEGRLCGSSPAKKLKTAATKIPRPM